VASQPIDEGGQSSGAPEMLRAPAPSSLFVNIFLLAHRTQNSHIPYW